MTVNCTLTTTGINPKKSYDALIKSYSQTSNPKYYQKYQNNIEKFFKNKLEENIAQAQLPDSLVSTFDVKFKSSGIYFTSNSEQALKYEFGSGRMPPKHFIEPAIIETANDVSQKVITDAISLYEQYIK